MTNEQQANPAMPDRRLAGVGVHITSLPGMFGIGEIGEQARIFVDTMRRAGLAVWQFLPTGPTATGDSPYHPLSTFAGNEMLIDVGDLVRSGFLHRGEIDELTTLPARHVDYDTLIPIKNRLLAMAAERFDTSAPSADKSALDAFRYDNDDRWLHDYALYRILKNRHGGRPWPEWRTEFVHRDPAALARLESVEAGEIERIKIVQYLFRAQWQRLRAHAREARIHLFGDMPIYVALDSADAWANRELLQLDADGRTGHVAGVPPDYFNADGQLWGNPLYDWAQHEKTGYRWWIDRLRASTELADLVRIDHFRGFESYWSVPAGSTTARAGAWEPGPGDAIFDAIRDALGELPIVAENLGVITPEVEALRKRHRLPGMHVLQFEVCEEDFALSAIEENSVCYTGTHDNDTTIGWFRGSPDDLRSEEEICRTRRAALDVTRGSPETIHLDMIRLAFSTDARIAIAPMQDFLGLGSEARINTPGTSRNNWRWRVLDTQLTPEVCDNVAEMVEASGRARPG